MSIMYDHGNKIKHIARVSCQLCGYPKKIAVSQTFPIHIVSCDVIAPSLPLTRALSFVNQVPSRF